MRVTLVGRARSDGRRQEHFGGGGAQTNLVYLSDARFVGGGEEEWDKFGAWEVIAGRWGVWMKAVRGEVD